MILRNLEGVRALDISPDWHANRQPGLSGLLRLKDEADWVALAIDSFLPWLDELVIVCQPCRDGTREIVEQYRSDKVRIFDYPVQELHASGPGHDKCPDGSIYASAHYYNWTLAHSTRTHAVKLDGDLVMMDWVGSEILSLIAQGHDRIKFHGTDLVGEESRHIGCHPHCPTDGVFKVTPAVHYDQGPFSQRLQGTPSPTHAIDRPAFLHFKWSKPEASATKRWPTDWRETEHFQRIYQRRVPVRLYAGEYPASLAAML